LRLISPVVLTLPRKLAYVVRFYGAPKFWIAYAPMMESSASLCLDAIDLRRDPRSVKELFIAYRCSGWVAALDWRLKVATRSQGYYLEINYEVSELVRGGNELFSFPYVSPVSFNLPPNLPFPLMGLIDLICAANLKLLIIDCWISSFSLLNDSSSYLTMLAV
jgi:hypothetical protein